MKTIKIIRYNTDSPGVAVIVDAFSGVLRQKGYTVYVTDKLPTRMNALNDILIPYGPKETYDLLRSKYKCTLSLMVDYYSMGQRTKFFYYLRNGRFFCVDFWKSVLTACLYYYRETYIHSRINSFMYVSRYDIEQMKKRFPNNNYFFVPNGVRLPSKEIVKTESNNIRLGILSNWNSVSLSECSWFIDNYLPHLQSAFKNIELVIAGKGASDEILCYFNSNPCVKFIGMVDNLECFFENIDIYIATVPRGCGILNKVLDAFAYQTFVIGIKESFSGFHDMKDCYLICNTINDYINAIQLYKENPLLIKSFIDNAYDYICERNQWEQNYLIFINSLQETGII